MDTSRLQTALNTTPFKGTVTKVFSSTFGNVYDVGLVKLENGEDVVIKVKNNPRARKYSGVYSREAEYKNLKALESLNNPLIPKALYYNDGVLLMSFIEGETLREANRDTIDPETYEIIGRSLREINDIDTTPLDHLVRFDSFRAFLKHELELFFAERVQLDLLPLSFYEDFRDTMMDLVNDDQSADIALIARDAYGAENILVKSGKVSGLIDFEDLIIAPRILQMRPPIEPDYLTYYIEGYGKDVFDKNYYRPHLDMLKAVSTLRALYLAHEQNAEGWKTSCIKDFNTLMSGLECDLRISISGYGHNEN